MPIATPRLRHRREARRGGECFIQNRRAPIVDVDFQESTDVTDSKASLGLPRLLAFRGNEPISSTFSPHGFSVFAAVLLEPRPGTNCTENDGRTVQIIPRLDNRGTIGKRRSASAGRTAHLYFALLPEPGRVPITRASRNNRFPFHFSATSSSLFGRHQCTQGNHRCA